MALKASLRGLTLLCLCLCPYALKLQAKHAQDSCACLSWASVYKTEGVKCGAVFEYEGQEMCTTFYETIQDPLCFNVQQGTDQGQWCYVSSECTNLKGGKKLDGTSVSWKMCTATQDDMSREKSVEFLQDWAKKNDIMEALLTKMTYPVWQGNTWNEMVKYFEKGGNAIDLTAFPAELKDRVAAAMKSGAPVVFDSNDNHPPHGILEGNKIFTNSLDMDYISGAMSEGVDMFQHPYKMTPMVLWKEGDGNGVEVNASDGEALENITEPLEVLWPDDGGCADWCSSADWGMIHCLTCAEKQGLDNDKLLDST